MSHIARLPSNVLSETKWCRVIWGLANLKFPQNSVADLSESVQGEDVLHRQDAAQVFFDGRFAVSRLVAVGAGG